MSKSVFCTANSELHASTIVTRLQAAGFTSSDISALLPDKSGTRDFALKQGTKAPEGALTGAGAGGALGGALGWLTGVGALAIPGLGPFIAAGPILAALSGAAIGAAAGGMVGGLVGMGLPEFEAKRYEGKLREGRILIAVHCADGDEIDRAKNVLESCQAGDITTVSESSVPASARRNPPVVETSIDAGNPSAKRPLVER